MKERTQRRILVVACGLCLVALAMFVWSVVAPTPASVMIAMSVGQGLGMLSLGGYVYVVLADIKRSKILEERKEE